MEKTKLWLNYIIIGIVSMIALIFFPMIGSTVGLGWNVPTTAVGWIVWIIIKTLVAILNIIIFHCFMCQAKINIKDNKQYIEARKILKEIDNKNYIPTAPNKWVRRQYGFKGTSIGVLTAISTVALSQAILTFDWIAMITYFFTIVMGVVFGVLQMKSAEEYWTEEYYEYALYIQKQNSKSEEKPNDNLQQQRI